MAPPKLTKEVCLQAIQILEAACGNYAMAATIARISERALRHRVEQGCIWHGLRPEIDTSKLVDVQAEMSRELSQLNETIRLLKKDNERLERSQLSANLVRQIIHECDRPPRPPKWLLERASGRNTGVPTLLLSDWHWGEVVEPSEVNGVNAFNLEIARRRAKRLFETTANLLVHHMAKPKYDYLVVPMGGDMISGNIHEELRETNEKPVSQCVMDLADVLAAGIDLMLRHFDKIYVPAVVGNHGRWDRKPRAKGRAFENYEWLLYQFLAKHYAGDDRVHFEIADGADLQYSIYDTLYLLTHGDQFRGGTGISGAMSPLMLGDARKRKRALAINRPFHYMVMGHWHQYIHAKGIIVNASLKGYDEYAFQKNFDFELPAQALWLTHKEWGITARWPVILEKVGTRF